MPCGVESVIPSGPRVISMASSSSEVRIRSAAWATAVIVSQRVASGSLGFQQVRRHHGRSGIRGEIDLLGVDHARNAALAAAVDDDS